MGHLPEKFNNRIKEIVPAERSDDFLAGLGKKRFFSMRINSLRSSVDQVMDILHENKIGYEQLPSLELALIISAKHRNELHDSGLVDQGKVHIQSLSSQLVSKILDPHAGDEVLDMCAAPGSKTSQMAALMENKGRIIAIERVRGRFHKLRSVLERLGVENTQVKCLDARCYRPKGEAQRAVPLQFDKILVDAPCSSEGRFDPEKPETVKYWSLRKIKEMKRKQKGLLHRGCQLLKKGGVLVYSTCTFAPEENEAVVDWVLRKLKGTIKLERIDLDGVPTYPVLTYWKKKRFCPQIKHCVRIAPERLWGAFFIAKMRKIS